MKSNFMGILKELLSSKNRQKYEYVVVKGRNQEKA
jgi:hypothetical protein